MVRQSLTRQTFRSWSAADNQQPFALLQHRVRFFFINPGLDFPNTAGPGWAARRRKPGVNGAAETGGRPKRLGTGFRARLRRWRRRSRTGSAAIEFAMVAPIFFIFLLGTIEIGAMFLGQFALQNATNDAARLIRTGQVGLKNMTAAQFRTSICNEITPILQCGASLQIDVESYTSFGSAGYTNPLQANGTLNPNLNQFSPGTVCSIVLVRAFYVWSVDTPLLTPFLVNMSGGNHLLTATAAFRNEPYNNAVPGC
jgi:Flp pilus assembly protein TadG